MSSVATTSVRIKMCIQLRSFSYFFVFFSIFGATNARKMSIRFLLVPIQVKTASFCTGVLVLLLTAVNVCSLVYVAALVEGLSVLCRDSASDRSFRCGNLCTVYQNED